MYKNQLQELAQRSCFSLPSYTCVREGPDHAPRFRAAVNFNGEAFESPTFCSTLRQAEHSAAEVALNSLSTHRGGGRSSSYSSLAARILDETGVYKNLLQEISQRVGAPLPLYTTFRSGLGHLPVFTCRVELAGLIFTGEPAKNKKQAEKNAAMAAWSSLKQLARRAASASNEPENSDEQEQIRIARAILNYRLREKMAMANNPNATPFPKEFPMQLQPEKKPTALSQPPSQAGSKILPLIRPKSTPRPRPTSPAVLADGGKFPAAGAPPYHLPVWQQHSGMPPYHGLAPPVTARTAVPVFSSPPHPPRSHHNHPTIHHTAGRGCSRQALRMASPVRMRQSAPVFAAPPPVVIRPVHPKEQSAKQVTPPTEAKGKNSSSSAVIVMPAEWNDVKPTTDKLETECTEESAAIERLKQLEI